MERKESTEFLSPNEFQAWQGLFSGFVAGAFREESFMDIYQPYTHLDYPVLPNSKLVRLTTRANLVDEGLPKILAVEIRYATMAIQATGSVIWQNILPIPQVTAYSPDPNLPKEKIIMLINKFGGILEQPMEYTHRGLGYRR